MQPAASRSQSAETFVVCRGYCGAKDVDPKFFDLNVVFKQVYFNYFRSKVQHMQ